MKTVTLISKDDCHLCDVAREVLLNALKKTAFNLNERKITAGDADFETYDERIPVILVENEFAFQYRVSEGLLLEKLENKGH